MRLIDADLIDMEEMDFHTCQTRAMACEAAQDIVDAQPTIDAEPVVYAHWIKHNKPGPGGTVFCGNDCSNCGNWTGPAYPCCPYCGAVMDEDKGEV